MAVVMRDPPLCTLAQLQDGTYSIADLAQMNDMIAVVDEVQARYRDKQKAEQDRGRNGSR